jgi:hypothetical protein
MRAYDEREREGVPVLVGIGWVSGFGLECVPVPSVVGGDVGAVRAYGDPAFGRGRVVERGAVAVGCGFSGFESDVLGWARITSDNPSYED